MNSQTNYTKISSYEAKSGTIANVLLLYSGGLDTSVMIPWLKTTYKCHVTTLTMDLGQQHDDLEAVRQKALHLGAKNALIADIKDDFADSYISHGIKANASYQGEYHLSTPIARAVTAFHAVKIAQSSHCDVIAHGCTGKGNDQVRLEGYILTLDPTMKILAPVREWDMDRNEEIAFAMKHHIPVPVTVDFPYSVDDNMWGMTWEGGCIEDPSQISPTPEFLTTYTLPENAPNVPEYIDIEYEKGLPVAINGKSMKLSELVQTLNHIAGAHGIGIVHMVEDRLIGLKNGGVYELPAAHVIISAHRALEKYVSTRELNEVKEMLDIKWGYLVYGAKWFDPSVSAINAFNDSVNTYVTGSVTVKMFKGKVEVVAMHSPFGLDHTTFAKGGFNVNASAGFIELYSMQMRKAWAKKNHKISEGV